MRTSILLILFAISTGLTYSQVSIAGRPAGEELINTIFKSDGEKYFRFHGVSELQKLSRIISVDKVENNGTVYAYANRKEFAKFLDLGIAYEILPHPGIYNGFLNMKSKVDIRNIEEWDFYPTYEGYLDMMAQFAEQYPTLCQLVNFGTSIQGRQLLALKISDNVGMSENEPQFLYTSSIHGDEVTGYVLMLRLIDYLLSNYDIDPRITGLVNNIEIWINPLANPDGTYHGGNNTVNGAYRYNASWVDLNRNYPDPQDGPHPDGEEWQTETLRFMELAENNRFVSSANLHGGEVVCNYPWDTWSKLSADDDWWQYVCHEYADTVHANCPWGYMTDFDNGITNGYAWYTIAGGRQDYMNYFHQCREFTLEISSTKILQPDSLPEYWDYNYRSFLNYLEQSTFGVRGTVKDSITGWPIIAEVYAVLHEMDSSWVYSSFPNGNYHRLLHAGTYSLRYSAPGYITKFISGVNVINRQATLLNVQLVPEEYAIIDNDIIGEMINTFPNPLTGNVLHIDARVNILQVRLFSNSGEMMDQASLSQDGTQLIFDRLPPGMYFIVFETEKGQGVKKLVISR